MNRRQFFKQIAGACTALVVAPAVVRGGKKPREMMFKEGVAHYQGQWHDLKWGCYTTRLKPPVWVWDNAPVECGVASGR